MRILLTGPTGFIGSAFARRAVARGHTLAGLIIPSERIPDWAAGEDRMAWFQGTLDEAPWREIASFAPECCIHTAWITTPGVYLESPENERFRDHSLAFLKQARDLGVKRIVGLGTCIEYQIGAHPLSELSTPIAPSTLYARCKNELRLALEEDASRAGYEFCWGRVFYPYGPGEHPSRLCSSIIARLQAGETISLKTPGSIKDYIYIDDLASALLWITEGSLTGPVNLGNGGGHAVRDLARELSTLLNRPELIVEAQPPAHDPFPFVVSDNSRLRATGWKTAWPLSRGLSELVQELCPRPPGSAARQM